MKFVQVLTASDALTGLIEVAANQYSVCITRTCINDITELLAKPVGDEGPAWLSIRCTKFDISDDEYQDAVAFLVNNVHEWRNGCSG